MEGVARSIICWKSPDIFHPPVFVAWSNKLVTLRDLDLELVRLALASFDCFQFTEAVEDPLMHVKVVLQRPGRPSVLFSVLSFEC